MRKLALRRRLEDYRNFVVEHRRINREDMARMGEISLVQASADMKALMEDFPNLGLVYDRSLKTFVATGRRLGRQSC